MNDSAEAPSSGSGNATTKKYMPLPPPPPQVKNPSGNGNASSEVVGADAPSSGEQSTGNNNSSPVAPPPPRQKSPPPPAAPPPEKKSPPPPSPPPPKAEAPPSPPQQKLSPPPPPGEQKSSSPPPQSARPPPPTPAPPSGNGKQSPPPPPPPSPSHLSSTTPNPPPKQATSSPPPPPPPPSTSQSPPPPPYQNWPEFPPPPPFGNLPPPTYPPPPPGPIGAALPPRVSPKPADVPNHAPPHTRNLGPTPGTIKGNVVSPARDGNGGTWPVAIGVAGVFIVAFVAIFFVVAKKIKKKDSGGIQGSNIPPKNLPVKSDGFFYGQPQSGFFPGQNDPFNSYSYANSQLANSNGSQRGYHGSGGIPDSGVLGGGRIFFNYDEIMEMTNGFSPESIIGEGGFGSVYKGQLPDGKLVAVKNLKSGGGQGDREFKAEVEIISRVHHRHLVSLVGYCIAEDHRVLIYEFVSNNTLDYHLHGKGLPVLEWSKRLKIALGAAKGLAYLHEDCHPKIIHRDIKSANILLEDDFEAQVADFGLARPNSEAHTHVSTRVMGTFGYLAPEYASSGKLTDKSDVYSFGVVLLELITGRKPIDTSQPLGDESLVEWARPLLLRALENGDFSEVVDPRLEKHYVESEMFRMIEAAAACIRHSASKRPRMMQVMRALDCEDEMSDLSNGVKYGQSTIYDSGQYDKDIQRFRRMAFGSGDCSDFEYTGECNSKDFSPGRQIQSPSLGSPNSSRQSSGSETRALNSNHQGFNL